MGKEWPAFRYGPNGEARIFTEEQQNEIPEGWADHPSKAVAPGKGSGKSKKKAKDAGSDAGAGDDAQTLSEEQEAARQEGIAVLRGEGVEIADDATIQDVEAALDALG